MLKVVAALIEQDGKILLAKRLKGEFKDMWEFPGGKVEQNESEENAIEREIKEEFDIEIKVKRFIKNTIYDYPEFTIDLKLYDTEYINGELHLHDHKEIVWINKNNILDYELVPADVTLAKYIAEVYNG